VQALTRPFVDRSIPNVVRLASFFYLAHIFCEGWIGSSQGFLGLAIIAIIVAVRRRHLAVRFHPLLLPLATFVVGSFISAAFSADPLQSLAEANEWFHFSTFLVGLTLYRSVPNLLPSAKVTVAILAIFISIYGLVQYFVFNQRDLEHRITGTAAHVMTYSGVLLMLTLFLCIAFVHERKWLWLAGGGLTWFALVLTFTRGAWLGWLAGASTFLVLRRPRWFAYAIPLVLAGIIISPLPIFGRLVSSFDLEQSSNFDRVRMIQAAVEMIKDRPLVGFGPGSVKETYPLYREPDAPRFKIPHLHNNIVQIYAERGLIPLFSYFGFFAIVLWLALRARRGAAAAVTMSDALIAITVALATAGMFEFNFGDTEVTITMLDIYAVAVAIIERPEERNERSAAA
jgi:O-antigen ligase